MRKFLLLAFVVSVTISFHACNLINPAEVTPTYVQIDSFSYTGSSNVPGSLSHKITNVWVYFNNAPVGNFELPARFPVLATDSGRLTVIAGVDYDGLKGLASIYPLYTSDYLNLKPQPGSVIHFQPSTHYNSLAKVAYYEDFERGAGTRNAFLKDPSVDTMYTTADSVFEGKGSGFLHLDAGKDSSVVLTDSLSTSIVPGSDAFIELDYKGSLNVIVGVWAYSSAGEESHQEIIGLKAQTRWTKIYVDIKSFISAHQNSQIRVRLRALKPDGVSAGNLYIDNLRVVSF